MSNVTKLLLFTLAGLRCALPLADVERTVRAVEITPAPKAPGIVLGMINVRGRIIPVLNFRRLLHLPEVEMTLDDQLVIAHTSSRTMAILVDNVLCVSECSEQDIIAPAELYPGFASLEGVTNLQGGIVYIYNLDTFLSSADKAAIELVLTADPSIPSDQELAESV